MQNLFTVFSCLASNNRESHLNSPELQPSSSNLITDHNVQANVDPFVLQQIGNENSAALRQHLVQQQHQQRSEGDAEEAQIPSLRSGLGSPGWASFEFPEQYELSVTELQSAVI